MDNNSYIQIIGIGILDLEKDLPVSLNGGVAQVQDIAKGDAHYSKPFRICGNKNNNIVMGHLYDINISNSSFNINVKNKAIYFSSGLPLLRGYIQLIGVNKISPTAENGDEQIYYEIIFFDDKTTFYEKLGAGMLSDMDLSRFNHTFNKATVIASSGYTWQSGFTYPQLYSDSTEYYTMKDFKPAVFWKTINDQMFEDAGFTYTSPFLSSSPFSKLILPFCGDVVTSNLSGGTFRASFSAQTGLQAVDQNQSTGYTATVLYDDETTGLNFDSGATFSRGNGIYSSKFEQTASYYAKFSYIFYWRSQYASNSGVARLIHDNGTGPGGYDAGGADMDATCILGAPVAGPLGAPAVSTTQFVNGRVLATQGGSALTVNGGNNFIFSGVSAFTAENIYTLIGQPVLARVQAAVNYNADCFWVDNLNFNIVLDGNVGTEKPELFVAFGVNGGYSANSATTWFYNAPVNALSENSPVEIGNVVPKMKKVDLWNDLVKMFNLYCEVDPDNSTNLIVKPREHYYSGGTIEDWTDKIDFQQPHSIRLLSELQNKTIDFNYTDDSDLLNKTYKEQNNLTYGELKVNFDNEFLQGTKEIKVSLSQTPLIENEFSQVVPYINGQNPKCNQRVLYHGGGSTGAYNLRYYSGSNYTTISVPTYNYAGEFDNYITPGFSLNFGNNQDIYYSTLAYNPEQTLYNLYWHNHIDQIARGSMLTCKARLTDRDINRLSFANKIFIKDTYYYLNSYSDYTPLTPGLTTLELLKIEIGNRSFPRRLQTTILDDGLEGQSGQ